MQIKYPSVTKKVLILELSGFLGIIILIWLNEILDVPARLFLAPATPVNWQESLVESIYLVVFGSLVMYFTTRILKKIRQLEALMPICSYCKKIRDEKEQWIDVDMYITEKSGSKFSHGICPECLEKYYPGFKTNSE